MENKEIAIIVGGGYSIKEGIKLDLWNKIKGAGTIFSINYAYKAMPFTPDKQVWLDTSFFTHNHVDLLNLNNAGCKLITKEHDKYSLIDDIRKYKVTRDSTVKDSIYIGANGLSGFFALSVAIREGYRNIYLLGYDFGTDSLSNRKTHFYQEDIAVPSSGLGKSDVYREHNGTIKKEHKNFDTYLQYSNNIVNVSPNSNIDSFLKVDYPTFFIAINR